VRILMTAMLALAALGAAGRAQEESCVSALQSRAKAIETVAQAVSRLDGECAELQERLDAFVAAETALRKRDKAVKRACPAGEFVRADLDRSAPAHLVVEVARKRLASCPQTATK